MGRIMNLIAARYRNNVICDMMSMIRDSKSEQIQFDELTTGSVVIMGRKTYERIGYALSGRITIVVSNTKHYEGRVSADTITITAHSLAEAIEVAPDDLDIYIMGGKGLYEEAIPIVHRMYITEIDRDVTMDDSDVFFPKFDENKFKKLVGETVEESIRYTRTVYVRRGSVLCPEDEGRMNLEWDPVDVKLKDFDTQVTRYKAALPSGMGSISLSRKKKDGSEKFILSYYIPENGSNSGMRGMMELPPEIRNMDMAKANAERFFFYMLNDRILQYELKLNAALKVRAICSGDD